MTQCLGPAVTVGHEAVRGIRDEAMDGIDLVVLHDVTPVRHMLSEWEGLYNYL